MRNTYGFERRVTEDGAYCLAILLLHRHTGRRVLWESKGFNGFDYFLGTDPALPFRNGARLEVSGLRQGNEARISERLQEKLGQIQPSNNLATGYVVVVEFGRPMAQVVQL
jgi:hypothetical protein